MDGDKKTRVSWTPELQLKFNDAVDSLGGVWEATPGSIRDMMRADLSLDHVKSHLQKVRKDAMLKSIPSGTKPGAGAPDELSEQVDTEIVNVHTCLARRQ